jgi:DNA-binding CsgD family transcriptional regulator
VKLAQNGQQDHDARRLLAELTCKQRQVLDLLLEHKTSKEIARELGISPHTVDQRVQFAREKLGTRTRGEAAVAYRRLLETCGQLTYENSRIVPHDAASEGAAGAGDGLSLPRLFEGRHGTLMRLGAIVAIAVLLVLLVLAALALFEQLSQLLAR